MILLLFYKLELIVLYYLFICLLPQSFSLHSLLVPSRETREFARFAISAVDAFCFNSRTPPEGSRPSFVPPFLTDYSNSSSSNSNSSSSNRGESLWECIGEPLAAPRYLRRFLIDSNGVGSVSPFLVSPHPSRPCCLPSLLSVCSYTRAEELSVLSPPPKLHFPFFLQFLPATQQQQQQQQQGDRILLTNLSALQQHNITAQQLLQQQTALMLLLLPAASLRALREEALAAAGGRGAMDALPLLDAAFQVSPSAVPFAAVVGGSAALAAAAVSLLSSRPLHLLPASLRQYPLHLLLQLLQSQRSAAAEIESLERMGLAARAAAGGPSTNPLLWEARRAVFLELTLLLADRFASAVGRQQQQQQQQEWVVAEGDKVPSVSILLMLLSQSVLIANVTARLWQSVVQINRRRAAAAATAAATAAAATAAAAAAARGESGDDEVFMDAVKAFSPKHLSGAEAEFSYLSAKTDALVLLLLQFSHFKAPAAAAAAAETAETGDTPTPMAEDTPTHNPNSNNSSSNNSSSSSTPFAAAAAVLQHAQWWRRVGDCRRLSPLFCLSSLSGKGEELSERQQQIKQQRGVSVHLSSRQLQSLAASSSRFGIKDILLLHGFAIECSSLIAFLFQGALPPETAGAPADWAGPLLKGEGPIEGTEKIKGALALGAPLRRAREWAESTTFFFPLLLMRSKCFTKIAAAAAGGEETARTVVAAVAAAAEAAYPLPQPNIAALSAAATAAVAAAAAAGGSNSSSSSSNASNGDGNKPGTPQPAAAAAAAAGAGGGTTGKSVSAVPMGSSLYAVALCDAADALLISCIQAFGADSFLGAEGKAPQLGVCSPRSNNYHRMTDSSSSNNNSSSSSSSGHSPGRHAAASAARKSANGSNDSSSSSSSSSSESPTAATAAAGERPFVSCQVSLQLYLQHTSDIESLVEAEGDVMPLVLPLYRLHALRVKILLQSGGRLWRLASLFPWKYHKHQQQQQQQQQETVEALNAALFMWRTGRAELLMQQQQQQQPVLPGDHLLPLQSAADVMRDAVDALQYLSTKR